MAVRTQRVDLADGRSLDVLLGGDEGGTPLVLHHGTPSDATAYADWDEACARRGLRLVSASRPGYATSTRRPGRDVADAAGDTGEVLDRLGHEAFLTAGWSGGGPHALASAALLPGRCLAGATLAGVGAHGRDDLDFLAGMGPENVEEFGAAEAGEAPLRAWLAAHGEAFRSVTGEQLAEAFGGLVPQVDKDTLAGGFADTLAACLRRALAGGFDGWVDDDLAFVRPWGFDLADVGVPVTVWQGDLDLMVPAAHGPWLVSQLPRATARLAPGHGHLSLVAGLHDEILDDLVANAG